VTKFKKKHRTIRTNLDNVTTTEIMIYQCNCWQKNKQMAQQWKTSIISVLGGY